MSELNRLFDPQAIAIYGVSLTNPFHPTNVIYHKNRLRYRAATYGINPRGGDLYGEAIYANLEEIPAAVDAAVVGVRAELVPDVLRQCIAAGLAGAIVISGGFAETGRGDLQAEVAALSRDNDFPVIGPNCLGVFSPPAMDTFFLPPERLIEIRPGGVTLVSQSGGILVDLMIKLTQEGAGIARGLSIGNRAAVDEVDLIRFLADDPRTRVIGLYLEGFLPGRGRDFVELIRKTEKPVVFMKSGKTPGGSRAVASHTASVAGDYRVLHDVLAQCGALEARSESEFVSFCEALSYGPVRPLNSLAIITASGGHGAVASDECYAAGLELPRVSDADAERLRGELSPSIRGIASLGNPIDLTGSASDHDFLVATRHLLARDDVDGAVVLLLPYLPAITPDVGARIAQISHEANKPVVTYVPHIEKYGIFIEGFETNGVPVSHSVQGAVHMARALSHRGRS
ncbi:MAG: CoA-binding protein [Deferrisomatales bacterium]|nr:CoA-binding protein [Deferrisomatales bacterium]